MALSLLIGDALIVRLMAEAGIGRSRRVRRTRSADRRLT
jgi:hypothetical protein